MRAWFSWPGYGWAREPLSDVWLVRSAALLVEADDAATREGHRDGVFAKASFTRLAPRSAQVRAMGARRWK